MSFTTNILVRTLFRLSIPAIVVSPRGHAPLDAGAYRRLLIDAVGRAHREHERRQRRAGGEA